ncbi:HlyD family efflux transporter periplasmic adaptor subunit [Sneathiella sp.]|uniref:HlyD family efflux transporter periplasmic adaptor subunit n=1 Tax=Sneathiella sp. TaxID=1964365 RepID=UPI0026179760|nr:HlyD family efflux transporter periplasmic adaptor subunit [Sneathiella sp.]MDF2367849.1 HlyD family efflux transporter periplasmic adaptor subunit [Sneathiella sp.]
MEETIPPHRKKRSRRFYIITILGFLIYVGWIIGPYIRSIIVRDAAITSWLNVATAPIEGKLQEARLYVAGTVGPDGVIAIIENDLLSRTDLISAQAHLDHTTVKVSEARRFLDDIETLDDERREQKSSYAVAFRTLLDVRIENLETEIQTNERGLKLKREIADRYDKLLARKNISQIANDEAWLDVLEAEQQIAHLRETLEKMKVQRAAADKGVFITEDGDDPTWVRGARIELKLAKKATQLQLREAEADVISAKIAKAKAEEDYARQAAARVTAPPGSVVWSRRAAPGATVKAGDPVAAWLDCSILMVDVPLADAEVPLLKPGMTAEVVLEGDYEMRNGTVIMTRGSAFTLGNDDLAALAKGRGAGVGQALIEFSAERGNFDDCPVGRAAYVNFPGIGLLDIIRARLRI